MKSCNTLCHWRWHKELELSWSREICLFHGPFVTQLCFCIVLLTVCPYHARQGIQTPKMPNHGIYMSWAIRDHLTDFFTGNSLLNLFQKQHSNWKTEPWTSWEQCKVNNPTLLRVLQKHPLDPCSCKIYILYYCYFYIFKMLIYIQLSP